jgi:hypothetical protein
VGILRKRRKCPYSSDEDKGNIVECELCQGTGYITEPLKFYDNDFDNFYEALRRDVMRYNVAYYPEGDGYSEIILKDVVVRYNMGVFTERLP